MRIIKKDEFYMIPAGTLYSEYEPCNFSELKVKGENILTEAEGVPFDYRELDLIGNIKNTSSEDFMEQSYKMEEEGVSVPLDFENFGRDGLYDSAQLYAVYEVGDIEGLIEVLQRSLTVTKEFESNGV